MKRLVSSLFAFLLLSSQGLQATANPILLDGNVTTSRVNDLMTEIQWNRSLSAAEMDAAKQGKMVFWVHMLGSMSGAT